MSENIEKRVSDIQSEDIEIDERRNYTVGDIVKICDVSSKTVTKWIDSGVLKGFYIPGSKDRRVYGKELAKFIEERGIKCSKEGVYTTGDIAEIFGISQQTVIKRFDAGDFEEGYHLPVSGFRRITRSSLVKFAERYGMMPQLEDYFRSSTQNL